MYPEGFGVVACSEEQSDFLVALMDQVHGATDGGDGPRMAAPREI